MAEGLAHSLGQSLSGTIRALLADLSGLGDHDCHELVAEIDAEARRSSKKLLAAEVVPLRGVAEATDRIWPDIDPMTLGQSVWRKASRTRWAKA